MYKKIVLLYTLLFLLLTGCALPSTPSVEKQMGVIAIEVDLRLRGDLLNIFPGFVEPTSIFFARVDKNGNIFNQDELYISNYLIGNTAYLFNAKPGTYVAVGFRALKRDESSDTQYTNDAYTIFDVLMPKKMIALTKVKVCAGRVSHMGEFHLVEPKFENRAKIVDEAQQHYYAKMIPLAYGDAYGKDYFKDKKFDLKNRAAVYSKLNPTFGAILEREDHTKKLKTNHLKSDLATLKDTPWEPVFLRSLSENLCR